MSKQTTGTNELPPASRLARMQAQFQQKQMQEKEQKLMQMFDSQQQKALQKASLNGVLPSKYSNSNGNSAHSVNSNNNNMTVPPGKVRQMFEERRKGGTPGNLGNNMFSSNGNGYSGSATRNGGIIGIDKSYPLEPIVTPAKSRTSSSRSDPNSSNPTYAKNARNVAVKGYSGGAAVSVSKRGGSQERSYAPISRESSGPTGRSTGLGRRSSSGLSSGLSSFEDDSNFPTVPTTTKYTEYANGLDTVAKRENMLALKLKKLNVSDDKPSSPPVRAGASGGNTSPPRKASPSPVTNKPSGTAGTSKSTAPKAGVAKKTVPSKPAPPPRSGPPPPGLDECKICSRFFASDRIAKHETICKKTSTKKRKVFDPTKMRMQGTEAEPYIRIVSAKPNKPPPVQTKKADWRKKHEEFINTIRAAKEYQQHVARGGDPADLPPPPPSENADYIQCPYCNRRFAEGAANRHIPKCKNIKSNKK